MTGKKQMLVMALKSTTGLVGALFILLVFQWVLKSLGAWISDFPGVLQWEGVNIKASSNAYQLKHVLWIYLFPYIGFVIAYFIISFKRRFPSMKPTWCHLIYAWTYSLLLISVFFLPLCEIVHRTGLYYALSWMYVNRLGQFLFGIVLILFFLVRIFRVSSVFSSNLSVDSGLFLKPAIIIKQVVFLWYIPYILLLVLVIIIAPGFHLCNNCLQLGIIFALIVNTPLIVNYKVIVK